MLTVRIRTKLLCNGTVLTNQLNLVGFDGKEEIRPNFLGDGQYEFVLAKNHDLKLVLNEESYSIMSKKQRVIKGTDKDKITTNSIQHTNLKKNNFLKSS